VMVGRAALGQPWLVGRISAALADGRDPGDPPARDRAEAALEHYHYLLDAFGERAGLKHARKHLAAYADGARSAGHAIPQGVREAIVRSDNPREVTGLLRDVFSAPQRKEAA